MQVFGGFLGLSAAEIAALRAEKGDLMARITPLANTPLGGFVVLDLDTILSGAVRDDDARQGVGADVIKIEPPKGESLRGMAPAGKRSPGSYPVAALNVPISAA